jgi:pimeloyl-ACP methyl ester carboxylesterase
LNRHTYSLEKNTFTTMRKPQPGTVGLRSDSVLQRILSPHADESRPQTRGSEVFLQALHHTRLSRNPLGTKALISAGVGTPTVVFESGLGHGKDAWGDVFNAVAEKTHVVAYDRAGYGQSERSSKPRHGQQIVDELRAMLLAENIPPPYVLVGHSLGGTIVKLFARIHPEEVAGVVLVDARHSDFATRCRQNGVPRVLYEPPLALFLLARPIIRRELAAAGTTTKQTRRAGPFPRIPLIVLTQRRAETHWPSRLGDTWVAAQRNMVKMSVLGRMEVCDNSGHNLHKDRPDVVVQAVLNVVDAVRYLQAKRKRQQTTVTGVNEAL